MRFEIVILGLLLAACQSGKKGAPAEAVGEEKKEGEVCLSGEDRLTPLAKVDPATLKLKRVGVSIVELYGEADERKIPVPQIEVEATTQTTVVAYKACPTAGGRCLFKHTTGRTQIIPELEQGEYEFTAYACRWDGQTTKPGVVIHAGGTREGAKLSCGPKTMITRFVQPSTPTEREFHILLARAKLESEMNRSLNLTHERFAHCPE